MKLDQLMSYFKKPKKEEQDYNPQDLKTGEGVEKEHVNPKDSKKVKKAIESNIARNHLDELPDYYEKLKNFDKN